MYPGLKRALETLANSLLYTIGWTLWIKWGSQGELLVPTLFSLVSIALQLLYVYRKNVSDFIQDVLLILQVTLIGFVFEIFFLLFGCIQYVNHQGILPPFWIMALYPLFSLLINHALKFAFQKILYAVAFGFLGAILVYQLGEKLGAALLPSWGYRMGIGWMILFAVLFFIRKRGERIADQSVDPSYLKNPVTLLFDGKCPICSREITFLKKRDHYGSIHFVDIAEKNYDRSKYQNIDYSQAMQKIHLIKETKEVVTGVDVFFELYARCSFSLIASILKAPLFYPFFWLFYQVFRKLRLLRPNLNTRGKVLRLIGAILLLVWALWAKSWLLFVISAFTFLEFFAGWCILYQLLGINSCPIKK